MQEKKKDPTSNVLDICIPDKILLKILLTILVDATVLLHVLIWWSKYKARRLLVCINLYYNSWHRISWQWSPPCFKSIT